jgi:tetratricopeptide (TPR) repeat protein
MSGENFDIFISYTRSDGEHIATLIKETLKGRGYRCFFDYDSLKIGDFLRNIEIAIADAPIFMPILTVDYINKCQMSESCVYKEVISAIGNKRNIIPIDYDNSFKGFPQYVCDEIKKALGANNQKTIGKGQLYSPSMNDLIDKWIPRYIQSPTNTKEGKANIEVYSDCNCNIFKADKIIATISKDRCSIINLSEGRHRIICQSTEFPDIQQKEILTINERLAADFMEVKLADKIKERRKQQEEERQCEIEEEKKYIEEGKPTKAKNYIKEGLKYYYLAEYNKALEYYNKALDLQIVTLGEKHKDTASSYNNIGSVYSKLGDYVQALEYYNKALELQIATLGEKHKDTANSYNNIGVVYRKLGDYVQALEYYNKSLEIRKEVLGEKHQDTASSYNNIGVVYRKLGDYVQALEYYNKALEIRKELLGEKHQDTATSYNNIGNVFNGLEKYKEALENYNKSLEIQKELLGEKHPDTATSYNNIGVVYAELGKYNEALENYNKALEIRKERLGEKHPDTKQTKENIKIAKQKLKELQVKREE